MTDLKSQAKMAAGFLFTISQPTAGVIDGDPPYRIEFLGRTIVERKCSWNEICAEALGLTELLAAQLANFAATAHPFAGESDPLRLMEAGERIDKMMAPTRRWGGEEEVPFAPPPWEITVLGFTDSCGQSHGCHDDAVNFVANALADLIEYRRQHSELAAIARDAACDGPERAVLSRERQIGREEGKEACVAAATIAARAASWGPLARERNGADLIVATIKEVKFK